MPIRSKFLTDRAISNEEFERRQQINASLVSDLADALRAPVGAALDDSLRQAMNDDWLVPAHMLLLELSGTEGRPAIEEVRHGIEDMLRRSQLQSPGKLAAGTSIEHSTREVALDAATHLLAQWHARVKEYVSGKKLAVGVLLDRKLAPIGMGSWHALLSSGRLARWSLKPEDLDPAFERFASLLERRVHDAPLLVGGGLNLVGIDFGTEKHLVLTSDVEVRKVPRFSETAHRAETHQASANESLMHIVHRVYGAMKASIANTASGRQVKMTPIEHAVVASFSSPDAGAQLDSLLSGQRNNVTVASQFLPSRY